MQDKMIRTIFRTLLKIIVYSYLLWIILSTILPQTVLRPRFVTTEELYPKTYDLNTETILSSDLASKSIYILIAHPDDEVMFFGPSILMLNRPKYGNHVKLISFSNGDYENLGSLRSKELHRSCQIFGIEHEILDFEDDIKQQWDLDLISNEITKILERDGKKNVVLITFDENGVSQHPNHISLYHGVLKFIENGSYKIEKFYTLKTWDFYMKYSFNFITNYEILKRLYTSFVDQYFFQKIEMIHEPTVKIFINVNHLFVNYASMAAGHFSQMIHFRYGWLFFSKYLNSNELVQVDISS